MNIIAGMWTIKNQISQNWAQKRNTGHRKPTDKTYIRKKKKKSGLPHDGRPKKKMHKTSFGRFTWFLMQNSNLKTSWNRTNVGDIFLYCPFVHFNFFRELYIIYAILSEFIEVFVKELRQKNRKRVSGKWTNISAD